MLNLFKTIRTFTQMRHSRTHELWRIVVNLTWLFFLLVSQAAYANDKSILILSTSNNTFTINLTKALITKLKEKNILYTEKIISSDSEFNTPDLEQYSLIIALNSNTTDIVLRNSRHVPVLSLLVSRQSHKILKQKYNRNNWSTLLLDHPYQRHLYLIDALFENKYKTGTILGPYSKKHENILIQSAKETGQELIIEDINVADQLIPTLKDLINKTDILLAVPDPVAFNKKTIRGILLLTYRKEIPVIGFTKSYVKAGAIAAIYSEAGQISNQASDIIDTYLDAGEFPGTLFNPIDFSVSTNTNVAHTLGIKLKPTSELKKIIKNRENTQ